jgi:glycosyltransferase involved in cell wall biosynthesis
MAMTDAATTPMFSILMPVYNHASYLREAVASVRAQRFTDWQLVICDDGSTDGSGEQARELAESDDRILLVRQDNAGAGPARNTARRAASGRWIAFLDSDDIYYPDALANFAEHIRTNPDHAFIYGYRHRLGDDGTVEELAGEFQDRTTTARELFGRMYMSTLCVTMRAELYDEVGGYDERLRSCEDYDFYLRLSPHTAFHPLGKATGLRRRHATNTSRQTGYSRRLEAAVLERYLDAFGGRDVISQAEINRRLGKIYYSAGRQYVKQGCFGDARRALAKSLEFGPGAKRRALWLLSGLLSPFGRRETRALPEL